MDYLAQRSLGMINGIQTPRPGTLQSRLWLDGLVHSCLFPRPSPDFRRSRGSKFEPAGPICPQPEKRDSSGGGLHTERDLAAPHIWGEGLQVASGGLNKAGELRQQESFKRRAKLFRSEISFIFSFQASYLFNFFFAKLNQGLGNLIFRNCI